MQRFLGFLIHCLMLCFLLSCPATLWADEKKDIETKESKLGEIVVTATKTPHTLEDVPVETVLITSEDIEKSNAKNVSEILREVPGFYIQGENVPGSSAWRARLRGLEFDKGYGLILINGERVHGGGMGPETGMSLNQIPVEMIEKIEIVKGPSSVLYGSDAMAGVVNIITKTIPDKPLLTSSVGYGSRETSLLNASYGQWIDKLGFFVSAHRETSERGRYGAGDDDFKGEYVLVRIAYKFSPSLILNVGINHDDWKWTYTAEERFRISPSVEITLSDDSTLKLKGYWYKHDLDTFSPGYTRRYGDIKYTQLEGQYTKAIGSNQLLTGGIEYFQRDIDLISGSARIVKSLEIKSLYLQDEITLKPFNVVIGARVDDNSLYGTKFNPKASLLWDIGDTTRLRLSTGKAFKSPTIRQLYVSILHSTYWIISNENLKPESSWGYSASLEHKFSNSISASLGAFRNDIKDIIVSIQTPDKIQGLPVRTFKNVQKAYTQGLELSANANVLENVSLRFGYTYLDTKNKDINKKLPYSPENVASFGLDYEIKPLQMSLHWSTNYISGCYRDETNTQKSGSHYISNLKIKKEITKNITASIDIDNIFKSDYGEPERAWLGRVIFAKLTMKI